MEVRQRISFNKIVEFGNRKRLQPLSLYFPRRTLKQPTMATGGLAILSAIGKTKSVFYFRARLNALLLWN